MSLDDGYEVEASLGEKNDLTVIGLGAGKEGTEEKVPAVLSLHKEAMRESSSS